MSQVIKNSTITSKPSFMGRPANIGAVKEIESYVEKGLELSPKAKRCIRRVDEAIDLSWQNIKKKKENKTPRFEYADAYNGLKVSLTPVYRGFFNEALLEIDSPKNIERILVRRDGTHFRYEKALKTDHGSMTGKTFDSTIDKDPELTQMVAERIESFVPLLIKENDIEKLRRVLYRNI